MGGKDWSRVSSIELEIRQMKEGGKKKVTEEGELDKT